MKKIGFIGAGSMAEAMVNGLVAKRDDSPGHIYMTNRSNDSRLEELQKRTE